MSNLLEEVWRALTEITNLRAEIARLTAEVERVRVKCQEIILDDPVEAFLGGVRAGVARKILRALDGE